MSRLYGFWTALPVVALLLGSSPASAASERVALVVGNGAYRHTTAIERAKPDAQALAAALTSAGFEVSAAEDLDRASMERVLRDFVRKAEGAKVVLLFYAGHGLQVDGRNHLVPIDAKLNAVADLNTETLKLDDILESVRDASRANIVILDACRDNPLARGLAGRPDAAKVGAILPGLGAFPPAGAGMVIAYSSAPGAAAPYEDCSDSAFSRSLVKHITVLGLEVRQMLTRVRADVAASTRNRQLPWDSSSLLGEIYLAARPIVPRLAGDAPQRAVLYIEDKSTPQGRQYVGHVTWRRELPAQGAEVNTSGVVADVDIPAVGLQATLVLRRNDDKTLSASHTIDINFKLPGDFNGGGIVSVPGFLMKSSEQTRGTPLAGLPVKVSDNFFMVGLSNVQVDRSRNIELLRDRGWIDLPFVFKNQQRAILAIEKGPRGESLFTEAFAAWNR